jgi:3-methyladenine DNA glycosylase/8-oxoguanine DNA glycosylase
VQPALVAPLPDGTDVVRSTFRYRRYGRDPASLWHDGGLHRVLLSGLAVRIDPDGVSAWGKPSAADLAEIDHLLGAGFDLPGLRSEHPDVYALAPGYRPMLLADPFEALATSVTAQQISLLAACAMRARLVERFGRSASHGGVTWYRFPRQSDLLGADLHGLGLSGAKRRTLLALAEADLDVAGLDDAAVRERLLALPGIGPWTVDWFLARCLGRPEAFAPGDLGVRKAVARYAGGEPIWPADRVAATCRAFGRHANLAVHYLLTTL